MQTLTSAVTFSAIAIVLFLGFAAATIGNIAFA
jgi:hypothetical protein